MTICPFCKIQNDNNSLYCSSCGKKLTSKNNTKYHEKKIICPTCRSFNSPSSKYCINCNSLLLKRTIDRNKIIDYWQCQEHKITMKEVDKDYRLIISKNISKDVNELFRQNKITNSEKRFISQMAEKMFREDPHKHYVVLSRVECPICQNISFAPIDKKTEEISLLTYYKSMDQYIPPKNRKVNVKSLIMKGWDYSTADLKQMLPIIISIIFILLLNNYLPEIIIPIFNVKEIGNPDLNLMSNNFNKKVVFLITYLLGTTFTSILALLMFKQCYHYNKVKSNLIELLKTTIEYLPKIFVINLCCALTLILVLILTSLSIYVIFLPVISSIKNLIVFLATSLIIGILLTIIVVFLVYFPNSYFFYATSNSSLKRML